MVLSLEQGTSLVKYARGIIGAEFGRERPDMPDNLKKVFKEPRGVFVTLHRHSDHSLRGCIGYPEPSMPLGNAVRDSAKSAAFRDPRFNPVQEDELDGLVVEVSVLTEPELIKVNDSRDYIKEVVIGRDGLIVEHGFSRGLLLPQVPVEWNWNTEEFLSHTCTKAGLNPDMWLDLKTKIYRFTAQIFSETQPNGDVEEKRISD